MAIPSTTAPLAMQFVSFPVKSAQSGTLVSYRPLVSTSGALITLTNGPTGAAIGSDGVLTWTPTDAQAGAQAFTIHAAAGTSSVDQTFTITVAKLTVQASATVDPADPNGAQLTVDSPLSPIKGAGIALPPGALAQTGMPVALSISSVDNAPVPASAALAGVDASDLMPIELGPSGTAFAQPVTLYVPVSAKVLAKGTPIVQTYDFTTGQWASVPVLSVDTVNGVVVAQASHFSTYVAAPPAKFVNLSLNLGTASTACSSELVVNGTLAQTFANTPVSAVNGPTFGATSLADLVTALPVGSGLQTYLSFNVINPDGKTQQGFELLSALRVGTNMMQINAQTSSNPGPLWNAGVVADTDVEAWLNGSRLSSIFGAVDASSSAGITVTASVSFYVGPAGIAPPAGATNAFGSDTASATMLTALMGGDADCDGSPDQYDPDPNGTPPPVLVQMPAGQVQVPLGMPMPLAVQDLSTATAKITWTADPSLQLVIDPSTLSATVTPMILGVFPVQAVEQTSGAGVLFNVIVVPSNVQPQPPKVVLGSSESSGRVGDTIALTAYGFDPQQSTLSYAWTSSSGGLLAGTGATATLEPTTAGDYTINVVGTDTLGATAAATITVSVLPAGADRPPNPPLVTPPYLLVQHTATQAIPPVPLTATATDPDGDVVTYEFSIDPSSSSAPASITQSGNSATLIATQDGFYSVFVLARDPSGLASPWTYVKIQVTPTIPANPTDADGDGYPAGIDCNDMDPTIHPGAVEICGDGIDQDCNGSDLSTLDCDSDHDHFSIRAGDCADNDPSVSPGVPELCDGKDNNCNGLIDEGFSTGATCTEGIGACQAAGTFVCNAARNGSTCSAMELAPTKEVCDGIDNDCDGIIDDVPGSSAGTVQACGSCGNACADPANTVPACKAGGCIAPCAAGFVDANNNPADGCECQITNGGVEICDGIDNDCNGLVDDHVVVTTYGGPATTLGVGPCHAGVSVCSNGQLHQTVAEVDPTIEVCNGIDDDCNGKVDDGFDLTSDNVNCGGCGYACLAGHQCVMSQCSGENPFDMSYPYDLSSGSPYHDGGTTHGPDMSLHSNDAGSGAQSCPSPFITCGTNCILPTDDPDNCGSCSKKCTASQVCVGGACSTAGTGGYGATCTTSTDCTGGSVCLDAARTGWGNGYCTQFCADGTCSNGNSCGTVLNGVSTTVCETTCMTTSDCVKAIPNRADLVCSQNHCQPACTENPSICINGATCDAASETCTVATNADGGSVSCDIPFVACSGGTCRLLTDDPANCGACGNKCGNSQVCSNGACVAGGAGPVGASCAMAPACMGGEVCLDTERTGYPSGLCTTLCDSSMCAAGFKCDQLLGANASLFCLPACTTDANCAPGTLCGADGTCRPSCQKYDVCPNGESCSGDGHCIVATGGGDGGSGGGADLGISCNTPFSACNGTACRLLTDDPNNCGACNNKCNATQVCSNGMCATSGTGAVGASCMAATDCAGGEVCLDKGRTGYPTGLCTTLCDSQPCTGNQLCSELFGAGGSNFCLPKCATDADCGTTGLLCSDNVCRPNCKTTPISECDSGDTCMPDGHCVTATSGGDMGGGTNPDGGTGCAAGLTDCATGCTNLQNDPNNCGGCNIQCPAAQGLVCSNGKCSNAQSCSGSQTQVCYDGPVTTENVGACKSGTQTCAGGAYGPCDGEVLPAPVDQCGDGIDNDCNGTVDDNCSVGFRDMSIEVAASHGVTLTVVDGAAPYTFLLTKNNSGGAIVQSTGAYTAGATAATDTVQVTDNNGKTAQASIAVVTQPSVTLTPANLTTNDPKPTITVQSLAGTTATYTVDGVSQGDAKLDADGIATINPMFGADGAHQVIVTATTPLGGATATGNYTVDTTPPATPVVTAPANDSTVPGPGVTFTLNVDSDVTQLQIVEDQQPPMAYPVTVSGGTTTVTFTSLASGDHQFMFAAIDAAGNGSAFSTTTVVLVQSGSAEKLEFAPGSTNLTETVNAQVTLLAQGGTPPYTYAIVTSASGGNVTPGGTYTAGTTGGTDVISVTDSTSTSVTTSITVQPSFFLTIQNPMNGYVAAQNTLQVTIAYPQNDPDLAAAVLVNGIQQQTGVPLPPSGSFVLSVTLQASGPNTIQIAISGVEGSTSAQLQVTYQGAPPTIMSPLAGQSVSAPFAVSGNTVADVSVQVLLDGMPVANGTSDGGGNFVVTVPSATSGAHQLAVVASTSSGSLQSSPIPITVK